MHSTWSTLALILCTRSGRQAQIAALTQRYPEAAPDVALMTDFLSQATPQRGIIR